MKTFSMLPIYNLGEDVQVLIAANSFTAETVRAARERVLATLTEFELMAPDHTLRTRILAVTFPTPNLPLFVEMAHAINDHIHSEASRRELAILRTHEVSARLKAFVATANLTEGQRLLGDETVHCLAIEAYRSAMVMGWNLAYDIVRTYIVKTETRRNMFNDNLKAANPKRSPINKYADFIDGDYPPSESEVLRCCRGEHGANCVLDEQTVIDLRGALARRNNYAHP